MFSIWVHLHFWVIKNQENQKNLDCLASTGTVSNCDRSSSYVKNVLLFIQFGAQTPKWQAFKKNCVCDITQNKKRSENAKACILENKIWKPNLGIYSLTSGTMMNWKNILTESPSGRRRWIIQMHESIWGVDEASGGDGSTPQKSPI